MEFVVKDILVLINRLLYCSALIPLVVTNYRLKTSRGLSDGLVWCLFNGYIAMILFSFCLNLPVAYGIISLVQFSITSFIIGQRFWYDTFDTKVRLARIYAVNAVVAVLLVLLAIAKPYEVGNVMGWVALACFVCTRIPQIIKIQRSRSVYGFSYGFSLILAVAAVFEIALVVTYNLPLQALATAVWSFAAFFIFTAQFYFFSWRRGLRQ